MPSAAVETAFSAKLQSGWTLGPVIGLNGVTEPPDPGTYSSFLVVQYPVVNSDKPVLNGKYFEEGAARLVLNVKSGLSLAVVLPWADTLASLFREYRPGGGFETFTPSAPILNDANDDGNWFELSVIVPYRYQFS
jgi:hypothetical protein